MKIALLGNMNNNFSALQLSLLDRGYDADLLLFDNEWEHFLPVDAELANRPKDSVRRLAWGSITGFLSTDLALIRGDLSRYDFIIGCGAAVGFLARAAVPMDLLVPYGSEILTYPFYKLTKPRNLLTYNAYVYYHRRGLAAVPDILFDHTNDWYESYYERLKLPGTRHRLAPPMVHPGTCGPAGISRAYATSQLYGRFKEIRERHDLVLFHPVRHSWRNPRDGFTFKSNDKLFEGFAAFHEAHNDVRACIVTFEYGAEVAASKELVARLGIGHLVHWFPVSPRRELMVGMSLCDLVVGELYKSYFSYGVVFEALCLAKPVMHFREDRDYLPYHKDLYPMICARTSDEVASGLVDAAEHPQKLIDMGQAGLTWYQRHGVDAPLQVIEQLLDQKCGSPGRGT